MTENIILTNLFIHKSLKIGVVLICLVILAMIFVNSMTRVSAQLPQDNFVTFGKSIFGVSIKHPVDWEVKDYDRKIRDDRVGYDTVAVMCPMSVLEHPYKEEYLSNITRCPEGKQVVVAVHKLPQNTTLQDFLNYLDVVGRFAFTGYKLGDLNRTTMSRFPAMKSTYTYLGEYKDEEEILRVLEVFTIYGNWAYGVSYFSPQLEFDDLLPTVQKMIESVKITSMPPCNFVEDEYGGKCMLSASTQQ